MVIPKGIQELILRVSSKIVGNDQVAIILNSAKQCFSNWNIAIRL